MYLIEIISVKDEKYSSIVWIKVTIEIEKIIIKSNI